MLWRFYSTVGVCGKGMTGVSAESLGSIRATVVWPAVVTIAVASAVCAGRPRKNGPSEAASWIAYRGRRRASLSRTFAPGAGEDAGPGAAHTRPSHQRPLLTGK